LITSPTHGSSNPPSALPQQALPPIHNAPVQPPSLLLDPVRSAPPPANGAKDWEQQQQQQQQPPPQQQQAEDEEDEDEEEEDEEEGDIEDDSTDGGKDWQGGKNGKEALPPAKASSVKLRCLSLPQNPSATTSWR
jgi:hypothetical protein